ncbi:semaphorin-2A-like isoform X3 [Centruroides sculpturatus]|uniref:semaphorin-2A-like isoform X3 n=1 Tax=Centruroides sculpturatus TaxID=218467 RepID=UPI000C6E2674|nr:semaphorin-2A-like isoform X3 [Centruroides sculpturatus]
MLLYFVLWLGSVTGYRHTNWGLGETCCGHLRHHREHVHDFNCGKLFYRTFYIDTKKDALYVGAMDKVFRLDLNNVNRTRCENDYLSLEPSNVASCVSKGKSEQYECRNHIRVIQPVGDGSKLYICGTNAYNPMDWVIYANLTRLGKNENFPGIGDGIAKCPFDPEDNATAVWVEHGNPGGLPGLYSGTVAEFSKADTVIFRSNLYNLTTGQTVYLFKRTIKYDSKWLDKPQFVGSFDIGDYVYFFFRESAVEYINCGKTIYSRVARVCKRDTGGKIILNKNWASYLKGRLNCSIPGEFPFYFNEIQNVYKHPEDDQKFYAVFSTSMNGIMGSAICTFSLSSIQEVFNGKFKDQATSSSAWLPVLTSKVPEPRPGICVNDTQTLPDYVLNFIRGHPLMDSAVAQDGNKPVFYKRDVIFTRLVVDKIEVDGVHYTVYHAGTSEGLVYKLVEWYDRTGEQHSNLVDIFEATIPEPVRAMEISNKHKSLYVASDSVLRQFDLIMCKGRYENCLRCIQDPYCGWDKERGECKKFVTGLLQDVTNATPGICDNFVKNKPLHVYWGQSLHLTCAIHMPEIEELGMGMLQWFHYSREKGKYLVSQHRDKYIHTANNGLVILSVNERDSGRYDCKLGTSTLCSFNITVDAKTCSAPSATEYRKIYSDWCNEFEKYKSAMKTWQNKQAKCQGTHPNDVTYQTYPSA